MTLYSLKAFCVFCFFWWANKQREGKGKGAVGVFGGSFAPGKNLM